MELTAPPPAKTGKKSVDNRKLSLASNSGRQMQQQQQATGPQRRYSQGMAPPAMMNMNNMSNNDSINNMQARRKISLFHNMKFSPIAEEQQKAASLNPNAPVFMMQQRRISRPSQGSGPPPGAFMMTSAQPISAWMNRRISGQLDYATSGLTLPPNVIRQPRGPENGKGFQKWCRSRMEPVRKPSKAVPIVSPIEKVEVEPKKEEIAQDLAESGAVEAAAAEVVPVVAAVEPVMVVVDLADDESGVSSEEDEGHFSDHDRLAPDFSFENERIR